MRNNPILTQINNKPKLSRVFRFQSTGFSKRTITRGELLSLQLAVTSSSTATTRLIESVRLDGVKITAFGDDTEAFPICFEWVGDRCPDICYTGIATLFNPFVRMFRPPENSLAGYWTTSNSEESEELFAIDPDNAVMFVDLHVTIIYGDGAPTGTQPVLTGASSITGVITPQLPFGTTDYRPVGLTDDAIV
jgi:hypothetical protein